MKLGLASLFCIFLLFSAADCSKKRTRTFGEDSHNKKTRPNEWISPSGEENVYHGQGWWQNELDVWKKLPFDSMEAQVKLVELVNHYNDDTVPDQAIYLPLLYKCMETAVTESGWKAFFLDLGFTIADSTQYITTRSRNDFYEFIDTMDIKFIKKVLIIVHHFIHATNSTWEGVLGEATLDITHDDPILCNDITLEYATNTQKYLVSLMEFAKQTKNRSLRVALAFIAGFYIHTADIQQLIRQYPEYFNLLRSSVNLGTKVFTEASYTDAVAIVNMYMNEVNDQMDLQ